MEASSSSPGPLCKLKLLREEKRQQRLSPNNSPIRDRVDDNNSNNNKNNNGNNNAPKKLKANINSNDKNNDIVWTLQQFQDLLSGSNGKNNKNGINENNINSEDDDDDDSAIYFSWNLNKLVETSNNNENDNIINPPEPAFYTVILQTKTSTLTPPTINDAACALSKKLSVMSHSSSSTLSLFDISRCICELLTTPVVMHDIVAAINYIIQKCEGESLQSDQQQRFQWFTKDLRPFFHIYRMVMPMYYYKKYKNKTKNSNSYNVLKYSMLDVLLQCKQPRIYKAAIIATAYQICQIQKYQEKKKDKCHNDNNNVNKKDHYLQHLQNMLLQAINSVEGRLYSRELSDFTIDTVLELQQEFSKDYTATLNDNNIIMFNRQPATKLLYPNEALYQQHVKIARIKNSLEKEFHEREKKRMALDTDSDKKLPIKHSTSDGVELPHKTYNSSLAITAAEMPLTKFREETKLMYEVNSRMIRPFYPNLSRPTFSFVPISSTCRQELKSIWFTEKGCLKRSVISDVNNSIKHGYINFANSACEAARQDMRWQIPIKLHDHTGNRETRTSVEEFFYKRDILVRNKEKIHDLGILIGGSEDQSLHHDIPRQDFCWLQKLPPKNPPMDYNEPPQVHAGWEYDRLEYNAVMSSPFAPCSVLIGMKDKDGEMYVGVQKNRVTRLDCPNGFCRVINGNTNEMFQIARETQYLVVLKVVNGGCMFTGDFPHAGVRNVTPNSFEDSLLIDLFRRIEDILQENEDVLFLESVSIKILNMMCTFENLDKLCRLHYSTEPIIAPLQIPRNSVGFVGCEPNPPREEEEEEDNDNEDNNDEEKDHDDNVPSENDDDDDDYTPGDSYNVGKRKKRISRTSTKETII